jgi:CBS domain containing-hemolysin-like protein
MTERLEIYLSGCQVGITVSSVGLGVVAEPALAAVLDPVVVALGVTPADGSGHTALAVLVSLAIINLLHVVIGEQAPTYLGIERTKFVAKYGAIPLYWWTKIMSPVILLSDRVAKGLLGLFGVEIERSWTEAEHADSPSSKGDVRRQMGDVLGQVDVSEERQQEVLNALDIGEIPVKTIMIERGDIRTVSTTQEFETNFEVMAASPHTRFPLIGDSLEDFRGVVYTPAVLRNLEELRDGTLSLEALTAPPMTVSSNIVVAEVIDQFQIENQELALVVEEDRVVGLVTATDAFEQITGDLRDPMDIGKI